MYCDFYQLKEPPFNVTPDPKFLYLNARYREAIASLNYGITQRKGFITLIGEAGTGKTTLLNKLLEELDEKTKSVFIFNTNVTFEEILEYMFAEFGLPVHNGKKLYMLQRLNSFLLEELRGGGNVALLIDEAQDLEFSVLEDLRLLSNLETAKEKILQIVLSGQPELGQKLSNPVLRQLRQRIGINCRLLPLSRDEITEYIQYRLQAAGCPDLRLFSREAEDQIYHFSRGIPRLVNVVCDNALVIGYALAKKRLGADVITEAAADLLSVEPAGQEVDERAVEVAAPPSALVPSSPSRWRARVGVMALVVVAMIVGLFSVGRTVLDRRGEEPLAALSEPRRLEVIRPGSEPQGSGVAVEPDRLDRPDNPVQPAAPPDPARPVVSADEAPFGESEPAADAPALSEFEVQAPPEPAPPRAEMPSDSPTLDPAAKPAAAPRGGSEPPMAAPEQFAAAPLPHAAAVRAQPAAAPKPADQPETPGSPVQVARAGTVADPDSVAPPKARQPPAKEGEAAAGDVLAHPPEEATAAVPTAPQDAPHIDGVRFSEVVVRSGDSMSGIAMRKYGQASYTILDLLKLANPQVEDIDIIPVGQTIRLPDLGEGFPILNDGSSHYALLVFSTPHASRASAFQKVLRARTFDARVTVGSVGVEKPMYRVVVSGFTNRDDVVAAGKELQRLFREDTRLAQLGE